MPCRAGPPCTGRATTPCALCNPGDPRVTVDASGDRHESRAARATFTPGEPPHTVEPLGAEAVLRKVLFQTQRSDRSASRMKIGVPKEVKNHEYRVAITPAGVHELVRTGTRCSSKPAPAVGSSITDEEYVAAGREDPRRRRRGLGDRRPDPQGEGADRRGVRPDARRPGAVHLPAPRRLARVHRRAAQPRRDRHRLRDGADRGRRPAAAGPDVGGRRAAGAAGRRVPPDAPGRRPGRADGRRLRCLRGQGRRDRRRCLRDERRRDRAGHAGRGAAARPQHRAAARRPTGSTRGTCRRSHPTRSRSNVPSWTPTSSSARCSCPAPRRRRWSPTSWSRG